jgi:hypothetical protein
MFPNVAIHMTNPGGFGSISRHTNKRYFTEKKISVTCECEGRGFGPAQMCTYSARNGMHRADERIA